MAGFVQIVQWQTSRIDEVEKLSEEYREGRDARGGGPVRVQILADKDTPNTYYTVAEFASAEEAQANSDRPETSAFAAKMMELCDGPPTFRNTELLHDQVMA
jgi:quinol monooxygenase YgiN